MNSKIVWFEVHLVWLKCHKKKKADRLFERISNRHITNHNIFNGRLLFEWRERISFTSLYYVFMKVQLFHIFHWKQKTSSAKKHHSDTNKEEEKNRSIFEIIISAGNTQPRIDWLMNVANHNNNSEHNYTHTPVMAVWNVSVSIEAAIFTSGKTESYQDDMHMMCATFEVKKFAMRATCAQVIK